jgi:hypothetical protein
VHDAEDGAAINSIKYSSFVFFCPFPCPCPVFITTRDRDTERERERERERETVERKRGIEGA